MAEAFDEELYDLWANLPLEILSLIQTYITRERDYNILRFICKSWRCILVLHRQSPFSIDRFGLRSPLLMSSQGSRYNFFHPLHHTYYMQFPELSDEKIVYSKDGWLLVKSGIVRMEDKKIFFFNPLTKMRIDLPDLTYCHRFAKFSFSGLPTSNNYVVVGISSTLWVKIGVFKFGMDNWQVDEISLEERRSYHVSSNPVFMDGCCYYLDVNGKVGIFDPNDVINSWKIVGKTLWLPRWSRDSLFQNFMVESDEALLAIFFTNDGRVYVYKLDKLKFDWIKVEDLDEKVIYLSNASSWVEKGIISKNKIYFPLLYDDKAIVFYSLSIRRYHSNGYDFSRNNFYDMKYLPHSSWIKIM